MTEPARDRSHRSLRVTVAMTHPVQYYSPWFRFIHANCPEITLTVIYATVPTAEQQGVGFGVSFEWDTSPLDGYTYIQLRSSRPGDYLHSDRFLGLDVRGMGRAIRDSKPDAVVVPGWYSLTLVRALIACRIHSIPTIYRGDTQPAIARSRFGEIAWSVKTRAMLRFFQSFLTPGERNRSYLRHFGVPDSTIFFAPHCVDNEFFAESAAPARTPEGRVRLRRRFGIPADNFVVLFVGKLDHKKRPGDVIAAAARLGDDVTTVIVGSGPGESQYRLEADELGSHVIFTGFVNQTGLGELYGAADVTVLPSATESETWGLVVNESLAAGTPCVVSDHVGCGPDLVESGVSGEIFPAGDVAALASALSRLREAKSRGHDFTVDCRRIVSGYSFSVAARGMLEAARRVSGGFA